MNKNFDYSKTYYKVTTKDEIHHGYQYKNGLNILKEEFNDNPKDSCVPGGFYFTDYENLPIFFEYGTWIREVTIPKGARVVKDPQGNKWRCDKIIFGKKYHIHNDFDKWFDPEKYDWNASYYLAEYCPEHFDKWFNSEKFDWNASYYLAKYCPEYFDKWFDPEKFDWKHSNYLVRYCSKDFDKWFDPEKFNWNASYYLAKYCPEYFDKWFDPEKYNWYYSNYLAEYCSKDFDKWFDPEKYDWYFSDYLAQFCYEHINKWVKYAPKSY